MVAWRRLAASAVVVLALTAAGLGVTACTASEADLLQTLKTTTDDSTRQEAAARLAQLHSVAATKELMASAVTGGAAVDGLGALRDQYIVLLNDSVAKQSTPGDTLPKPTVDALKKVMDCLRTIGDARAIAGIGDLVCDPERQKAGFGAGDAALFPDLSALQQYGLAFLKRLKDDPAALEELVQAATLPGAMESTARVREAAAEVLAGNPEVVDPLIAARAATVDEDAVAAIDKLLVSIGDPAVAPLVSLLGAEVWPEDVLRRIGAGAVAPLTARLTDEELATRYAALGVLLGIGIDGDTTIAGRLARADAIPLLIAARQEAGYDDQRKAALGSILSAVGEPAIQPVMALAGTEAWAREVLAGMGAKAVPALMKALQNEDQAVKYGAADTLVLIQKANPQLVSELMAALEESDSKFIATNYPFYLRLGQEGTEDALIRALTKQGTKEMCDDYLQCGNEKLDAAARTWAAKHGYEVDSTAPGSQDGPQWGKAV
jgi:hypothetical protein